MPHKERCRRGGRRARPGGRRAAHREHCRAARRRLACVGTAPTAPASSPRSAPTGVDSSRRAVRRARRRGAARSVVDALAAAARPRSSSSTAPRASGGRGAPRRRGRRGSATLDDIAAADIVVNATSVGMGTDELAASIRRILRAEPRRRRPRLPPARDGAAARRTRAAGAHAVDGLGHARPPGRPSAGAVDRRAAADRGRAARRRRSANSPHGSLTADR